MQKAELNKSGGFTLLEILAVMVLIAIFIVLAVTQYSKSDVTLTSQTQVLKSHLRYAQMRSINTDTTWGIFYHHDNTTSYYYLFSDHNINNIEQLPGETRDRVDLGDMGITIGSAVGATTPQTRSFQIEFDDWGRPSSTQLDATGTGSYTLELYKVNNDAQRFVVTRNTGFIQ